VRDVFDGFDTDGSGAIGTSAVADLLTVLGLGRFVRSKAELEVVFLVMDGDGSGDIDFEEFFAWFTDPAGGNGGSSLGSGTLALKAAARREVLVRWRLDR
jgi:Ca2+-binding EF-hand superfamily protein